MTYSRENKRIITYSFFVTDSAAGDFKIIIIFIYNQEKAGTNRVNELFKKTSKLQNVYLILISAGTLKQCQFFFIVMTILKCLHGNIGKKLRTKRFFVEK